MSTEGGVFVRIGGQVVPLILLHFVAVDDGDIPSEAFAPIRCDTCAALSVISAPVTYKFYDDDHVFRFEVLPSSSFLSNHIDEVWRTRFRGELAGQGHLWFYHLVSQAINFGALVLIRILWK